MKNLLAYWLLILAPLVAIFLLMSNGYQLAAVAGFFIYVLYRSFIDFARLQSKGLVTKADFWKLFMPGYRFRFFQDLYLK